MEEIKIHTYYLAMDIGTSSIRQMFGHLKDGKMFLEEMQRFPNEVEEVNGHLCWNLKKFFGKS